MSVDYSRRDSILRNRVRGEQLQFLRTLCNRAGTKASSAKYVGNGLGVVSVNPYGCNAPATPLGTWNIDLNGLYSVSGIVMNAITIPTQGETAVPSPLQIEPLLGSVRSLTCFSECVATCGTIS